MAPVLRWGRLWASPESLLSCAWLQLPAKRWACKTVHDASEGAVSSPRSLFAAWVKHCPFRMLV